MARVGTPNLNLGTWTDSENPGAGSQTVNNTGLNGDKIKIDTGLGTEHNADGTHKADKIDGPSLKTTTVDGSSLQATGTPRKLSVKDTGIQKNHINSNVADADSLQKNGTSGALEIKTIKAGKLLGTGTGKAVDASTIGLNGSNELEVKDDAITAPKISHDNTRTKCLLAFAIDPSTKYGIIGNVITSATVGVPIKRAGCVTAMSACTATGVVVGGSFAYTATGYGHFAVNSKVTVMDSGAGTTYLMIDGNPIEDWQIIGGAIPVLVTLEIEFDD